MAGTNERWYFPPAGAAATPLPHESFTPISVIQAPRPGATEPPLTYAYVDNLGNLWHGHQEDADNFNGVQWTAIGEGEAFSGQPVLSYQADSRVQVVAHNTADGDTWLRTQTTAGQPQWNPFQDVGGSNLTHPTVGRLPDGKLVVFTLAGGGLWHLPQDGVQAPYLGWRFVGGSGLVGRPVAVTIRDGLQLFAADANGALHTATYRGGALSDWTSLGGTGLNGIPAVVVYPGFRLRVFARSADGTIVSKVQDGSGAFGATWEQIGDLVAVGSPGAVLNPNNGLTEVVARTADGSIHYVTETAQASGVWGVWQQVSNTTGLAAADPSVVTFSRDGGPTWGFLLRPQQGNPRMYVRTLFEGLARGAGDDDLFTAVDLPALPG
ncbi:hypothetical protein [Plantactinospora sp. B5E13]|uniref:hypothetical protein n=1 Tax=Plantactinospora sp. B5E13 TaxID=3153758 RepID=UPI00325CE80F